MAPQNNLNLGILATPAFAPDAALLSPPTKQFHSTSTTLSQTNTNASSRKYLDSHDLHKDQGRKKRFPSFKSIAVEPFNMIQALLTPGVSAASCNEETLSSSFLILDGFLTISLGALNNENSSEDEANNATYNMLEDATERWGARLETNICVGKVSYEYRHESEEEEEKCMSFSSSDGEDDCAYGNGSILSQKLDLIPLVLDDPSTLQGKMLNPERYVPPSHKMVADCLKFREYVEATAVYLDILKADQERYGEGDLVCAIDYHNLGVTALLVEDLDAALNYFKESVEIKRACLEESDATIADSLVEIGIILHCQGNLAEALNTFNEALEIYMHDNNNNNNSNSSTNDPHSSSCLDSIGRTYNNIGCVYYKMGEIDTSLLYMQKSLVAQRNALGLNSKAESALMNYALTQANTGYLKCKSGMLDSVAILEDSLLVLESVMGDDNMTVANVKSNISFAKQM